MIKWSGCLPQKKEAAENHTVDFLTASFYENGRRKICIYYTIFCEKRYPFFEKKLIFFNFFCNFLKKGILFRKNKEKRGLHSLEICGINSIGQRSSNLFPYVALEKAV